jgi:hypothetical protein
MAHRGLNHLTRRQAWCGWFLLMVPDRCVHRRVDGLSSSDQYGGYRFEPGAVENFRDFATALVAFFLIGLLALMSIMLCAVMGVPVGTLMLWLGKLNRSLRWRRRRRRFRKVRTAA